MVKTVVGDEVQLKSFEERLVGGATAASLSVQVGLVIGKLRSDSDRGYVYALIPAPPTESGSPACSLNAVAGVREDKRKAGSVSKGGKSSTEPAPSLTIDGDWVAEHAHQVSRMLLGGMSVLGVYLWASEASFKATPPALLAQVLRGTAQATSCNEAGFNERLLIHVSYSPRRWVCKVCNVQGGSTWPCDFKFTKLLSSLQVFKCTYNFDIRFPTMNSGPLDAKNVISKGINNVAKKIQSAIAVVDGELVSEDTVIKSDHECEVEYFEPLGVDGNLEECRSEEVSGLVVYTGSIYASIYLAPKEPVSQAISDLKADIIATLRSRAEILFDDTEGDDASMAESSQEGSGDLNQIKFIDSRKHFSLSLPRRVLVPWMAGIFICDYLTEQETVEDTKNRCREMMSFETPAESASSILEPEIIASPTTITSFWDAANGFRTPVSDKSSVHVVPASCQTEIKRAEAGSLNILLAAIILVVALVLGFILTVYGGTKTTHMN